MKKALVTGGTGFLGARLCEMLHESGWEVTSLDIKMPPVSLTWRFVGCDLTQDNLGLEDNYQPDVIFHLAAAPWFGPPGRERIATNVFGTVQILEYAARVGARVILASSAQIYGPPVISPQDENHRLNPVAPYPWSKWLAEQTCEMFLQRGQDVIIARFANLYGPNLYRGTVISDLIASIAESHTTLKIRGTGHETRDFIYVDDVATALMLLAVVNRRDLPPGKPVFNIGSGVSTSINELALLLMGLMEKHLPLAPTGKHSELDRDHEVPRALETTRLRRLTGWEPTINLIEGLQKMLESVNERGDYPMRASAR